MDSQRRWPEVGSEDVTMNSLLGVLAFVVSRGRKSVASSGSCVAFERRGLVCLRRTFDEEG